MIAPDRDIERGKRIKYVRADLLKIKSQEAFAEWVGEVSRGAVGNWERGLHIGLDNLTKIASKADIPLDWLAYGKGARPAGSESPDSKSHDDVARAEAMAIFDSLPQDLQQMYLEQVRPIGSLARSRQRSSSSRRKSD